MSAIQFDGLPKDIHSCTVSLDGDWIVWRCPFCRDYERRLNWQTGEMSVRRGGSAARHCGFIEGKENMDALTQIESLN